jgi:hypothetical protein
LSTNSSSAVLIGSQRPSLLHLPSGQRASVGPEAVDLAASAGLVLDDWQSWSLEQGLSEAERGQFAAFEVGLVVPRQNGKGSILEARQLAGLFLLGERLQVHTAHEFRTTFEHFLRLCTLIESTPELDRMVARIRRGAGEQAIELKTGERLRFIARSGGSGRGMSGDTVYLDEAFAVTPVMMGALLPTMSARPNPQLWLTSSAPMSSSVVLHQLRQRAIAGDSPRLFYAEWGNDEGVDPDSDVAVARANPALGIRIPIEFISAEREAMPAGEYLRERLGVPDPLPEDSAARPVKLPADAWSATVTYDQVPINPGEIGLAFDVSPGGEWSSVAIAAGSLTDPYVEVIEHQSGTGWLPGRLVELVQKWQPTSLICDSGGPAGSVVGAVIHAMRLAGISSDLLHQATFGEMKQACGAFYADVVEGRLRRPPNQGPLDNAAADAAERRLGESWAWDRRNATVPISPLVAVTLARSVLSAVSAAPESHAWASYLDL